MLRIETMNRNVSKSISEHDSGSWVSISRGMNGFKRNSGIDRNCCGVMHKWLQSIISSNRFWIFLSSLTETIYFRRWRTYIASPYAHVLSGFTSLCCLLVLVTVGFFVFPCLLFFSTPLSAEVFFLLNIQSFCNGHGHLCQDSSRKQAHCVWDYRFVSLISRFAMLAKLRTINCR